MSLPNRATRVADMLQRELTYMFYQEVKDPRLAKVSVTEVEMSSDLVLAKVYVRIDGDDKQNVFRVLHEARGFFRKKIAERIQMRNVPELRFQMDDSDERYQRIDSLLAESRSKKGEGDNGPA